jgi:hypothetical protein
MYPQIGLKAQLAVASYVLRRVSTPGLDPKGEKAQLSALIKSVIPHASLVSAQVVETEGGLRVKAKIKGIKQTREAGDEEGYREVDPEWFVLALALTTFGNGCHSHIKRTSPTDASPLHYVYIFEDGLGLTWQHLIAGAGAGEEAQLGPNHKVLCMEELTLAPSARRTWKDRETAIGEALRLYQMAADKAAAKGTTLGITKASYEATLRAGFKLLDDTHGHKLKREPVVHKAAAE